MNIGSGNILNLLKQVHQKKVVECFHDARQTLLEMKFLKYKFTPKCF